MTRNESFDNLEVGEWHTVDGETVADIANAVSNYNYVKLDSGRSSTRKLYTHNGTSQIYFNGDPNNGGDDRTVFVDAMGAEIEVKTEGVVDIENTSLLNGKVFWVGGYFNGTNSDGDVGFRLTDALFNTISPEMVRACEVGGYARNVDGFCEFNRWGVGIGGFQGNGNDYTLAFVGNSGTAPGTLTMPSGSGTDSFRGQRVWAHPSPTKDGGVGLYFDHARPYFSEIFSTTTGSSPDQPSAGDAGITGIQFGSGNGQNCSLNGTDLVVHQEQGGTMIQINDILTNAPDPRRTVVSPGGVDTVIDNSTPYELFHNRPVSQESDGSSTTYGGAFYADNVRKQDFSSVGPGSINWHWEDFPVVSKRGDNEAHIQLRRNGNPNAEFITHGNGDFGIQVSEGNIRPSGGSVDHTVTNTPLYLPQQDLSTVSSDNVSDIRYHTGTNPGLYRGNGSGGWVKIEDNAVTI